MSKSLIPVIETNAKLEKIAGTTNMTAEQVAIVKSTVAKNTTDLELAYFLNVCRVTELDPFMKEIWCYKDKKGNMIVFAGRDGFLKKAQKNPAFSGIRSSEIRERDEYSIDIPNGKIEHKITAFGDERGKIIGAYAIVFRKEGEPTIELVEFDTYNKKYNAWATHPADMIKKVAEAHALKKAMGISNLQLEDDYRIRSGVALPGGKIKFDLIDEIADLRKDVQQGLNNEDWIEQVCMLEFGHGKPRTKGEEAHIKEVISSEKYNLETGELK